MIAKFAMKSIILKIRNRLYLDVATLSVQNALNNYVKRLLRADYLSNAQSTKKLQTM